MIIRSIHLFLFLSLLNFSNLALAECDSQFVLPAKLSIYEKMTSLKGEVSVKKHINKKIFFTKYNNAYSGIYFDNLKDEKKVTSLKNRISYYSSVGSLGWAKRNALVSLSLAELKTIIKKAIGEKLYRTLGEEFHFTDDDIQRTFNSRRYVYDHLELKLIINQWLNQVHRSRSSVFEKRAIDSGLHKHQFIVNFKLAKKPSRCR